MPRALGDPQGPYMDPQGPWESPEPLGILPLGPSEALGTPRSPGDWKSKVSQYVTAGRLGIPKDP